MHVLQNYDELWQKCATRLQVVRRQRHSTAKIYHCLMIYFCMGVLTFRFALGIFLYRIFLIECIVVLHRKGRIRLNTQEEILLGNKEHVQ